MLKMYAYDIVKYILNDLIRENNFSIFYQNQIP